MWYESIAFRAREASAPKDRRGLMPSAVLGLERRGRWDPEGPGSGGLGSGSPSHPGARATSWDVPAWRTGCCEKQCRASCHVRPSQGAEGPCDDPTPQQRWHRLLCARGGAPPRHAPRPRWYLAGHSERGTLAPAPQGLFPSHSASE